MRKNFLLDKEWRFLPGEGEVEAQKTHSDSYNSSKAGQERGIPSLALDDSSWRVVNIPHDYFTETEFKPENLISHGYKTRHNAWYRKSFKLPREYDGKHIMLSFEGMAVTARVYFNGSLVGRSFSAYAPLDIDVTDRAFFGDRTNVIAVYIDGMTTEGWWYEGAGIYRHVRLIVKEPLHIAHDSIFAKPELIEDSGNDWRVICEATAENSSYEDRKFRIRTELLYKGEAVSVGESEEFTCPADGKATARHTLVVTDPARWDIDDPELYTARFSLVSGDISDEEETTFGFRTFTVDPDKGFFLNGREIKLKGTCNHQDHAGVGVAVPDSIQYYRIKRLKELGTNAYRCSHNMPAKEILDACDRLGLLVMDENRRFESRPEVLGHVEAMVKRDRNHPSVVMWSLFNEEPMQGTKEGGQMFRRMKQTVLKLDDSRIVTGAMNGGYNDENGAAIYMDATGINYGIPGGVLEYRRRYPLNAVYGSENNSAVTTRGCYKTDRDAHTLACYDEEQVPWGQLVKDTWKFTREHDWFGGIFIWTGFDYRGEPTPYEWPSIGSQFGIMDTCGFPKDSFYQNRACFVDEPMLHILPHWNWKEGEEVRVMTASNCDEVELFLNGKSLGRKPSDCCAPAEWNVKFEPGTLSAVGYIKGKKAAQAENKTAGEAKCVKAEAFRTTLLGNGEDATVINLSIVDKEGVTCETENRMLSFELIGDGVLLGVGNGDPNCLESDHEPRRSLYAGHCQAIVQTKPDAKSLVFRASADGAKTAEVVFDIIPAKTDYIYECADRNIEGVTVSSETYAEMPDALREFADNDMNSLEPISFDYWNIKPAFTSGYKLFRAKFKVSPSTNPDAENTCTLIFRHVNAKHLWLYIDGKLIADKEELNGALEASFGFDKAGEHEMRLVLEANDGEKTGIRRAIGYRIN